MRKQSFGKGAAVCCYLSGVLSPIAWGFFTVHTRNTFHLEEFQAQQLAVCLGLSLLPLILFFLARLLQRRSGPIWGELLSCMFFLVAAACWLYTLVQQWPAWDAALATGSIAAFGLRYLRVASVVGATSSLLPLLVQLFKLKKH